MRLTFCITAPLVPLAYMISKIIKAEFSAKDNPLNSLGILFSMNQFLYLLIAMWVYPTVPGKMVMVIFEILFCIWLMLEVKFLLQKE